MSQPIPSVSSATDSLRDAMPSVHRPDETGFDSAWVGLEPTFATRKSVEKWRRMSRRSGGEDAYFRDGYMLRLQKKVAKTIRRKYERQLRKGRDHCLFDRVECESDRDPWGEKRWKLSFHGP